MQENGSVNHETMTKYLPVFLILLIVSCGQDKVREKTITKASKRSGWKIFDKPSYSIEYPASWELKEDQGLGLEFLALSDLESNDDNFRENVNVVIQNLVGQNIDLDEYTTLSEKQVKTMLKNAVFIESKRIKKDTIEYRKLIYEGNQLNYHLQFEQYYFIKNNKAYVVTYTAEKNKFSSFKSTGEKILNSFKLK
jgi:hypothetical protein